MTAEKTIQSAHGNALVIQDEWAQICLNIVGELIKNKKQWYFTMQIKFSIFFSYGPTHPHWILKSFSGN